MKDEQVRVLETLIADPATEPPKEEERPGDTPPTPSRSRRATASAGRREHAAAGAHARLRSDCGDASAKAAYKKQWVG